MYFVGIPVYGVMYRQSQDLVVVLDIEPLVDDLLARSDVPEGILVYEAFAESSVDLFEPESPAAVPPHCDPELLHPLPTGVALLQTHLTPELGVVVLSRDPELQT